MKPRLTSKMLVSALVRRVNDAGGAAVVAARGDLTAGSILLICLEKGTRTALRERVLDVSGAYAWAAVGPDRTASNAEVDAWVRQRKKTDPDLWIVELDIAQAERFAAETSGDG